MAWCKRAQWQGYGVAVLAVAVATAFRVALRPLMGDVAPMDFFILAIVVSGYFGGLGPALFATVAGGVMGAVLFLHILGRAPEATPDNVIYLMAYCVIGGAISLLGASRDNARQAAEGTVSELRASDERFRGVFELADIPMAQIALDGRFVEANQGLVAMLGLSRIELFSKKIFDVLEDSNAAEVRDHLAAAAAGDLESVAIDCRFRAVNAGVRAATLTLVILKDPSGTPAQGVVIVTPPVATHVQTV